MPPTARTQVPNALVIAGGLRRPEQWVGRPGQISTGDQVRITAWERSDMRIDGVRLPVRLSHDGWSETRRPLY
jgi:hypothetical protein